MDRLRLSRLAAAAAFVVATLSAPPVIAQISNHSKETVMKSAAERWGEAFNESDVEAVVALYTDDAELLPKGTQVIKGRAAIRNFVQKLISSRPPLQQTVFTHVETFGHGDAVSEIADVEIDDGQGKRTVLGRQILVLQKQDGQWKIHRDMWTNNDQPDAPSAE